MKRPWQVWTLFLFCVVSAGAAMAWLSLKALELDQAEALARRQASLEENVNLALWRMDTMLTPLLAQEAARSPLVFQPFYWSSAPDGQYGSTALAPSPLLRQIPTLVRLHFQAAPDGRWTSPQCPRGESRNLALRAGIRSSLLQECESLLQKLQESVAYADLLPMTPDDMLPAVGLDALAWNEQAWDQPRNSTPVVANMYGYDPSPQPTALPSEPGSKGDEPISPKRPPTKELRQQQAAVVKGQNDLQLRNRALQVYAQQQVQDQRMHAQYETLPPARVVNEGASRSFWVGDKLILARRVQMGDELLIQGCWLDWDAIEARLRADVVDLLPDAALAPLRDSGAAPASRVLATLPIQVIVPPPATLSRHDSPLQLSLAIAWVCLAVASLATAAMLWGVVSLSERRAAFVAAVTHELRTPLTTFRLYSEMLAQGIAPPDKRQEYVETLQIEADRLTHLVENVLAYARLERGRRLGRPVRIALRELLAQWTPRLADRAAQADLHLVTNADEPAASAIVATDPQVVGQILVNLVDNAAKYAADSENRRIELSCRLHNGVARICVRDHGPGLPATKRRTLFRPFSKTVQEAAVTAPGVGLGLALSRRLAWELGGRLDVESPTGVGAAFVLTLPVAGD